MKALLTVVMALALTPFFANADDAAKTTEATSAEATSEAKKEEAAK